MPSIDEIYDFLKLATERRQFEAWRYFHPYPKQQEFMDYGSQFNERLLIAGNRVGKSDTGAFELSRHLTGVYPDNWKGKRFDQNSGPVKMWAAGPSGILVRDVAQTKLFGPPGVDDLMGTGFLPKEAIIGHPSASRSAANAFDTAHLRHVSGGVSHLGFKSYEQDRRIWQGDTLHGIWFDEEPPLELYTEGQARLITTGGISWMTFTPLFGHSEVVKLYLEPNPEFAKARIYVQMALADAGHMTPEMIERTLSAYPRHEWPARREGSPHLAGGRVFTTPDDQLLEPHWNIGIEFREGQLRLPAHWPLLWAVDFTHSGSNTSHPFAAVLGAWDRDLDTAHLLAEVKMMEGSPTLHAEAMKRIGANVPVAWPHDGNVADMSGEPIAQIYRSHGLKMLLEHAQFTTGGYSTEAGVLDLDTAMHEGRFKTSMQMTQWMSEYRMYHRDPTGKIVKVNDDLMSATRIWWMARRFAKVVPLGPNVKGMPRREMSGAIINPWSGKPLR